MTGREREGAASRWSIRSAGGVKAGLSVKPPHNVEAEQAILGAMFLSAEAVEGALAILQPEDFYRPAHARIYSAMSDLNSRSVPVDHLSVADRLESTGELDAAGGKTVPARHHRRRPHRRRTGSATPTSSSACRCCGSSSPRAPRSSTMGYDAPDDLDEVVGDAEKLIFDVTNKRVSSNFAVINDLLKVSFKKLEELAERKEHVTGVPHRLQGPRQAARGPAPRRPVHPRGAAVGRQDRARAQHGGQRSAGTARRSRSSRSRWGPSSSSSACCAPRRASTCRTCGPGYVKDSDWYAIHTAMGKLAQLDFWVDDTPSISILEVRAKARRQLRDKPKGFIIVDYLQLMQPQGRRSENRQTEIAEIIARTQDPRQGAQGPDPRALAALPRGRAACGQAPAALRPA